LLSSLFSGASFCLFSRPSLRISPNSHTSIHRHRWLLYDLEYFFSGQAGFFLHYIFKVLFAVPYIGVYLYNNLENFFPRWCAIQIHICKSIHTHIETHTRTHIHTNKHIYVWILMHIHTDIHTYSHTHTLIEMRIVIHVCAKHPHDTWNPCLVDSFSYWSWKLLHW
jgi:hypothetical protein